MTTQVEQTLTRPTIQTVEEYKDFFESLTSRLRLVKQDTTLYVGKPFSELMKRINEQEIEIAQHVIRLDKENLSAGVTGISFWFTTREEDEFIGANRLLGAAVVIMDFSDSVPYEKASRLLTKYTGGFTEEVNRFYSQAVIEKIEIGISNYFSLYD